MFNKKKQSNTNEQPRHELGYIIGSPTPYCLTLEDIYGKFEIREPIDQTDQTCITAGVLAEFLTREPHFGKDGKIATLDEGTFVRSWLPHFYSDGNTVNPVEGEPSITSAWILNVAGHVYNHVDILREGKLLYRVPPMMGRLNAIGAKDREKSVSLMYKDMEETLVRVPHAYKQQLNHLVENLFNPADPDKNRTEFRSTPRLKNLFTMDEIFTYYGYDSILTPEIMSIKPYIMGDNNESQSRGSISHVSAAMGSAERVDDDDDLFG